LFDQTSDQIILGMMLNPDAWEKENIIKIADNPEIKRLLHTNASMVSYASFFTPEGNYILEKEVRDAQAIIPKEQGVLEKALIKLDEKVNIVNMIFSGSIMKLFPRPSDSTNTWLSPAELMHEHQSDAFSQEMRTLFLNYLNALNEGVNSNDFEHANSTLAQISAIQKFNGAAIMPSDSQLNAELFLNKILCGFPVESVVNTQLKITKKETGKQGIDLIKDLETEKDFKITPDIHKAVKENKVSQLTDFMNKVGIAVKEKDIRNIDSSGLPKYKDLYDELKKKGFDVAEEYIKAKKIKQGSKYLSEKIKKKLNIDVDKTQIVEILKHLGVKK
jgi:hypothetical protein